jgi:hypothetical protein
MLNALVDQYPHRDLRTNPLLTLADLEGEDRTGTTVLAEHIRSPLPEEGSETPGVKFPSEAGYGCCPGLRLRWLVRYSRWVSS